MLVIVSSNDYYVLHIIHENVKNYAHNSENSKKKKKKPKRMCLGILNKSRHLLKSG